MQRAVAHEFAVEPMPGDERLDLGGSIAKQFEQPLAMVGPKPRRDIVGREPHAGVDQADVAPGAAETDLDRLQRDNLGPRLRAMQRRREPGIAAADNRHVGPNLTLERRSRRGRRSGHFPQAVRERVVLHGLR